MNIFEKFKKFRENELFAGTIAMLEDIDGRKILTIKWNSGYLKYKAVEKLVERNFHAKVLRSGFTPDGGKAIFEIFE